MLRFDHKVIHALHAAAVDAGLSRDVLLAGINPGLVASLARASTPGAQLRLDLARLNRFRCCTGLAACRCAPAQWAAKLDLRRTRSNEWDSPCFEDYGPGSSC